jgi:hypothetical protein
MEKEVEIVVKIVSYETDIKEVEITFPTYVKRNYKPSKSISYMKFVDKENYFEISLPKDPSYKYAQFFYSIEFNSHVPNDSYSNPYKSHTKEYTSFSTPEEFENALKRYKEEFLNKI